MLADSLGSCVHHVSETCSSADYLWSIMGTIVLPKVRYLVLFKILPSGAIPNGDKIPAGPVISARSGWMYWG